MRKRSITDREIALIKGMIARGDANKDIQFYFNRPDRSVNSGRISGIKSGSYSNSAEIPAAPQVEIEAFITAFEEEAALYVDQSSSNLSESQLKSFFKKVDAVSSTWQFTEQENERIECKTSFRLKHPDKWLRAVAALANNKGGYLFFGVQEKVENGTMVPFQVVGLNGTEFHQSDLVEFTKLLRGTFDPTPTIARTLLDIDGKKVGVLYVEQHKSRPVIALKNIGNQISEGDIFFRYPAESRRIKYSDLRAMLDERDKASRVEILPMVERLLELGPQKAMVADLGDGVLSNGKQQLLIDPSIIDEINFIKEGEFHEQSGSKTLKLVGEVQAVEGSGIIEERGALLPHGVIDDFLRQELHAKPTEYIRCIVEIANRAWMPVYFFASKAKLAEDDLIAFINGTSAPKFSKKTYIDRLKGDGPGTKVGGAIAQLAQEIAAGTLPEIVDAKQAASAGAAINSLESKPELDLKSLLGFLTVCMATVRENGTSNEISSVRRAVALVG
eukprot:Skav219589  [mRNA]  locus=scaffold7602:5:1510:- [translate_table: standard]